MKFSIAVACVLFGLTAACETMLPTRKIEQQPTYASTELVSAVLAGKTEVVKFRLQSGENANSANKSGKPILQLAILKGHNDMVKLLLDRGADPTVRDLWNYNWSALEFSAYVGNFEAVRMLLKSNARFSVRAKSEALHLAAGQGCIECVELLVKLGVDVNYQTDQAPGSTPLMEAVDKRYMGIAQYLLEAGANPNISDKLGNSLFDYVDPDDVGTMKDLIAKQGSR